MCLFVLFLETERLCFSGFPTSYVRCFSPLLIIGVSIVDAVDNVEFATDENTGDHLSILELVLVLDGDN